MVRSVKEWRGRTDDAMPPQLASLRIWERCKGRCAHCDRKLMPGDKPARDHIVPLADGGENVESNFQILCGQCHSAKTSAENSERATVRSMKAKHIGLRKEPHPHFRKRPGTHYDWSKGRLVKDDAR